MSRFTITVILSLVLGMVANAQPTIFLTNPNGGNLLRVDPISGTVSVEFNVDHRPRHVEIAPDGSFLMSLRDGPKTVRRFATDGTVLGEATGSFLQFGPGQAVIDDFGRLVVATDNDRRVVRYDWQSSTFIDELSSVGPSNVHAVTSKGHLVYSGEIFSTKIVEYDTSTTPPVTRVLNDGSSTGMDRIIHFKIGHMGNLFATGVSLDGRGVVHEFDRNTGELIREFADLSQYGLTNTYGIDYDPYTHRYYVSGSSSSGFSSLFELDSDGTVIQQIDSPLYSNWLGGLKVIPEIPAPATVGLFLCAGLAATRRRR